MKICFLSSLHPPTDKRVFDKEAVTLASAGFEVIHVAPGPHGDVVNKGVRILTEPTGRGIFGRVLKGPVLFIRAMKVRAECYHCNEVDSWLVGVALKLCLGAKVVFDAHEAYPEGFAESRFPQFARPAVTKALRILFRILLLFTDRVVLAKESIAEDYPVPAKQVLVRNYVSAAYANQNVDPVQKASDSNRLRVIHLGLISRLRGWEQILVAAAESCTRVDLIFVGTFNDGSESDFHVRAHELGITNRVTVIPWLPFNEAFREVCAADIGIIAFQPGTCNHVKALPHKMFDYMVAGLPVVAPAFALEVARIIRDADCGLLVDPSNPQSVRAAFEDLGRSAAVRARLGANGRVAVRDLFNWENEARRLVGMYAELLGDRSSTSLGKQSAAPTI